MSELKIKDTDELFHSKIMMDLTWEVNPGKVMTQFFHLLQTKKRLHGMKCPKCKRVYLPPRPVCGNCWVEMDDWVTLENRGEIVAKTVCHYTLLDNTTGIRRPTPFVLALVQLYGADTSFNHFVETDDPGLVQLGKEVEIIFRDQLQGNMQDILYFKLTGN